MINAGDPQDSDTRREEEVAASRTNESARGELIPIPSKTSNTRNSTSGPQLTTMIAEGIFAKDDTAYSSKFDNQIYSGRLASLTKRLAELQVENSSQRQRLRAQENESHEVIHYFQRDIEQRDLQLKRVVDELTETKRHAAAELASVQRNKQEELDSMQSVFKASEAKWSRQLLILQTELESMSSFRAAKDSMQSNIKNLEAALEEVKAKTCDTIANMERHHIQEKATLQREFEKKLNLARQQAKEDARSNLDADTKKIIADNRRMKSELHFQIQAAEELHHEQQELKAKAQQSFLEVELLQQKEHEFACQAEKQQRTITKFRQQVQELQVQLSESYQAFEEHSRKQQQHSSKVLSDKMLDIDGLKQLIRLKNKELRNIRHLSETVLSQRTLVEQFLLESIEHVRKEIVLEHKEHELATNLKAQHALRRANGGIVTCLIDEHKKTRFPTLRSPRTSDGYDAPAHKSEAQGIKLPAQQSSSTSAQGDPSCRKLTWEERERVLRFLFAKISGYHTSLDKAEVVNEEVIHPKQNVVYYVTEPNDGYGDVAGINMIPSNENSIERDQAQTTRSSFEPRVHLPAT